MTRVRVLITRRDSGQVVEGSVAADAAAAARGDFAQALSDWRDGNGEPIELGDATISFLDPLPDIG